MNTISTLSRSFSASFSKRALPLSRGLAQAVSGRYTRTFSREMIPEEDYYDGHLLADHLEYLDDMLDKTLKLENSMTGLKETHDKKYEALKRNGSDTAELDALFHHAASQKSHISGQVTDLKKVLMEVTDLKKVLMEAQNNYAVDGPDGTADGQIEDDLVEIDKIIDYAVELEDVDVINKHEMEDAVKKDKARDHEHEW
jgi:hypothetical protein